VSSDFRAGSLEPFGPVRKKRKLNRVPAGAADWDIPYPFECGEGPKAYRDNWEKERGKQLIAQLVGLIKGAAKKAAIRKYLESETKVDSRYYRPETALYGRSMTVGDVVLADTRNAKRPSTSITTVDSSSNQQPNSNLASVPTLPLPQSQNLPLPAGPSSASATPFDNLIASLLAASPTGEQFTDQTVAANASDSSSGADDSAPQTGLDQGLFDSWMQIIQTFPVPQDGFGEAASSASYPSSISDLAIPPQVTSNMPTLEHRSFGSSIDDGAIDPALLAISRPPNPAITIDTNIFSNTNASASASATPSCPSLAGSPFLSSSGSFGDPMTPPETWDSGDLGLGIFSPGESDAVLQDGNVLGKRKEIEPALGAFDFDLDFGTASSVMGPVNEELERSHLRVDKGNEWGKGKQKASENLAGGQGGKATTTMNMKVTPVGTPAKSLDKKDVLRRARDRKRQLEEEINKTRIELWEMTMEEGMLLRLAGHYATTG